MTRHTQPIIIPITKQWSSLLSIWNKIWVLKTCTHTHTHTHKEKKCWVLNKTVINSASHPLSSLLAVSIKSRFYPHWNRNILIYLLTPWSRVLLDKLASLQLVKKFPAFYGTRRFLTALTSARHLSLSWASPIQSIRRLLEMESSKQYQST